MKKQVFKFNIRIVYFIVFLSLVGWAYFAYHTLSTQITNQKIYAKIINLSGKQRMLSQKTALIAKRLFEKPTKELDTHFKELISTMKNDHVFIINNLTSLKMKSIYFSEEYNLNKKVEDYVILIEDFNDKRDYTNLNKVVEYSFNLLPKLNYAVNEFQNESDEITKTLLKQEQYILAGTLITLFIESLFIVFPMIRREEKAKKDLEKLNENLEEEIKKEIAEINKKDEIIFQQSKMTAMGDMLQNIAHQWRQPLSIITTASSGMKLKKELEDLSHEEFLTYNNLILENANYLSQTIEDFKNFYSKNKKIEKFNLENIIQKSLNLISTKIKEKDISTQIHVSKDIDLEGYENEFMQVILNILNNSIFALDVNNPNKKIIEISANKNENFLQIEFIDNAGGILPENINRVFEAYFTTKHKSKGTGIGLHMCYEIITKHFNGNLTCENIEMTVDNVKYKGAKFKITLS